MTPKNISGKEKLIRDKNLTAGKCNRIQLFKPIKQRRWIFETSNLIILSSQVRDFTFFSIALMIQKRCLSQEGQFKVCCRVSETRLVLRQGRRGALEFKKNSSGPFSKPNPRKTCL